jgi:hypothetical protein
VLVANARNECGFLALQHNRVPIFEGVNHNEDEQGTASMASEGNRLPTLIGDRLRQMFQQAVEEPLPPLILQVIRRLHEREEADAEASASKEPIKPIKWDLIVPSAPPERPRN